MLKRKINNKMKVSNKTKSIAFKSVTFHIQDRCVSFGKTIENEKI